MKGRLLKKVASVSVAASMLMLAAAPAMGQTVEELLKQIQALQEQLARLQGGGGATACTFTRNLFLGVRGDDVKCLQDYLKSTGHFPSTQASTGYYGPVTRSAVAAWQAANGVSPAAGYFGPLSRAKYNALLAAASPSPTPTQTPEVSPTPTASPEASPTPTPGLQGAEGTFKNVIQLADVSGAVLREGQDNVKVIGVEFEASGSDLKVERVDVLFAWDSGDGSTRPWRYFNRVALYNGDELVVSKPAASSGDWSDEGVISGLGNARAYKMSFTGVGEVVRMGEKMNLYVAVSMQDTLDTQDTGETWKVRIPANGIRAVDAAGINQYAPTTAMTDSASTASALVGSLELSYSVSANKSRVAKVDANLDTNDVEVVNFTLKAKDADVKVTAITATATESFAGSNVFADGARRFKLYRNAALVKSVAAPNTGSVITFSDLNLTVSANTTDEFVIKADMRDTESGRFVNGNTLQVTAVGVTAEDPVKGNAITPSGSVSGGSIAFFDRGISVTLLEKTATRYAGQGSSGTYDTANFVIKFRVTAFGGDAYVMMGATKANDAPPAGSGTGGASYDVISTLNDTEIQGYAAHTLEASAGDDGTYAHKVLDGQYRDFTLTVGTRGTVSSAFSKVGLEAVYWATTDTSTSAFKYDYGLDADWQTQSVELKVY